MAEQTNQQEKTEPATPKRRQDAREKGQVAKSIEINSTAILVTGILFLFFFGGQMMLKGQYYMQILFENVTNIEVDAGNLQGYFALIMEKGAILTLPFMVIILFVGLVVNFGQVGFMITGDPLLPKWSKINPLAGFKRIFASKRSIVELIKNIFKIILISVIAYYTIKGEIENYIPLMDYSPYNIFAFAAWETFEVSMKIVVVFLMIAVFDYAFQKHDFEESIKMTKQEVKDDLKQMEGDPQIKARIRSIQREQARKRMMQEVPEADVVITNPTMLAIAIKYDMVAMDAPVVVAKGARLIAEKIRKIAEEKNIPIVQDKPLARALYKAVEVGDQIPEEFFQAVAEILAYVYKLKNKRVA